MSIQTITTSNSLATEVIEIFKAVIYMVVGFFFGQRETEHKTFAKNINNESNNIHDTNSLPGIG